MSGERDSNIAIAIRLMRLAVGGTLAQREAARMVAEKVTVLAEAQTAAVAKMMPWNGGRDKIRFRGLSAEGAGKPASPRPTLIWGPEHWILPRVIARNSSVCASLLVDTSSGSFRNHYHARET